MMGRAIRTLAAVVHTAACSAFGIVAMGLRLVDGDWVMWNIGRRGWSVPLLSILWMARRSAHPRTPGPCQIRPRTCACGQPHQPLGHQCGIRRQPHPIVFLSKASIRKVPCSGNQRIGRHHFRRARQPSLVRQGGQDLDPDPENGRSVLVFPEGTRSADGSLKPFKKGAFHLAAAAGAPWCPCTFQAPTVICPHLPGDFKNPTRLWLFGWAHPWPPTLTT